MAYISWPSVQRRTSPPFWTRPASRSDTIYFFQLFIQIVGCSGYDIATLSESSPRNRAAFAFCVFLRQGLRFKNGHSRFHYGFFKCPTSFYNQPRAYLQFGEMGCRLCRQPISLKVRLLQGIFICTQHIVKERRFHRAGT